MSKKKDKPVEKVESSNAFLGVSPQGAAIFAPGKHPKDRQLADKKDAEAYAAGNLPPKVPEAPVVPTNETKSDEGSDVAPINEAKDEEQSVPPVNPGDEE